MFKTSSKLIVLQSLIDAADDDEVGEDKNNRNKTNLSNSSASKKSIGAGYLTSKGAKKVGSNTKKVVKAVRGSNYLTSDAKKAFNLLRHVFIQVPIFEYFDLKRNI